MESTFLWYVLQMADSIKSKFVKAEAYKELTHLIIKTKSWSFKITSEHSGAFPEIKRKY